MKSEIELPVWMTASQYAKHRCVSRQYVAKLIKGGLLPMRGRLIDAIGADRLLDDRPDAGKPTVEGQTGATFSQAKTICMVYAAKSRKLEYQQKTGVLIEFEPVCREAFRCLRQARDSFLTVPDHMASVIAAQPDPAKVAALLRSEFERILGDLADALTRVSLYRPEKDLPGGAFHATA